MAAAFFDDDDHFLDEPAPLAPTTLNPASTIQSRTISVVECTPKHFPIETKGDKLPVEKVLTSPNLKQENEVINSPPTAKNVIDDATLVRTLSSEFETSPPMSSAQNNVGTTAKSVVLSESTAYSSEKQDTPFEVFKGDYWDSSVNIPKLDFNFPAARVGEKQQTITIDETRTDEIIPVVDSEIEKESNSLDTQDTSDENEGNSDGELVHADEIVKSPATYAEELPPKESIGSIDSNFNRTEYNSNPYPVVVDEDDHNAYIVSEAEKVNMHFNVNVVDDDIPPPLPPKKSYASSIASDSTFQSQKKRPESSLSMDSFRNLNKKISGLFEAQMNYQPPYEGDPKEIRALQSEIEIQKEHYNYYRYIHAQFSAKLQKFKRLSYDSDTNKQKIANKLEETSKLRTVRIETTLKKIKEVTEVKDNLVKLNSDRKMMIARLKPFQDLQSCAQSELMRQSDKEEADRRYLEDLAKQKQQELDTQSKSEAVWLSFLLSTPRGIAKCLDATRDYAAEYHNILPYWQQIIDEVGSRTEAYDRFNYVIRARSHQVQTFADTLQKVLIMVLQSYGKLYEELKRHHRRIEWQAQVSKQAEIEESLRVDRLCPWTMVNQEAPYAWGPFKKLSLRNYLMSESSRYQLGNFMFPFDITDWKYDKRDCTLAFMGDSTKGTLDPPFAKGTYRNARYAQGVDDGVAYVVKAFHLRRGIEKDTECSERVGKGNCIAQYCALQFTHEISNCGFADYSLGYIDVWVAECTYKTPEALEWQLPVNTCVMVEPWLQGRFQKWVNNNMTVVGDEPGHVDCMLMEAFAHWSFEYSGRNIIISDLQGLREYVEGGKKHWRLMDPAIHFVGNSPEGIQLKKALEHDMDGDLGYKAVEHLAEKHKCNAICKALKLPQRIL